MSTVRTEITIKNAGDVMAAERGFIPEGEIRALTVEALADTGAWTLVINEDTCQKLGLKLEGPEPGVLAVPATERAGASEGSPLAGSDIVCQMTEGVEVHWKNRKTFCPAIVVPGADDVLFGALPMEGMDLIVHPRKEEVVGAHGDTVLRSLK